MLWVPDVIKTVVLEDHGLVSTLLAQAQQSSGITWAETLRDINNSKLAILLIFGTGLVSAIGYALSGLIRAYHSAPDDSEELTSKIDALEKRIDELERQRNSSMV